MLLDSVYFALPKIDWEDKMTSNSYGVAQFHLGMEANHLHDSIC